MRWICGSICVGMLLVSGCGREPEKSFTVHGDRVIITSAKWEREIQSAMVEVHDKMANWIVKDDGIKSDPTYKAGSKSWSTDKGNDGSFGYLEFTTAEGHTHRLETFHIAPKDLVLIHLTSTDKDEAVRLYNQCVQALRARGFELFDRDHGVYRRGPRESTEPHWPRNRARCRTAAGRVRDGAFRR